MNEPKLKSSARAFLQLIIKSVDVSSNGVRELKSIAEIPPLFYIISELCNMPHINRIHFIDAVSGDAVAKEFIKLAIKSEVIIENTPSFNSSRNGLLNLWIIFSRYFGINTLYEFDSSKMWKEVIDSLVDDNAVWRKGISTSFVKAIRQFVKLYNTEASGVQIALKAYSNMDKSRGRAPKETAIDYASRQNPSYKKWAILYDEWMQNVALKNARGVKSYITHFIRFLIDSNNVQDPYEFLLDKNKACFWSYIKNKNRDPRPIATRIQEFSYWLIRDKLSDEDGGEFVSLATPVLSQDVFQAILTYCRDSSLKSSETTKGIIPTKYLSLIKKILTEDDFSWPKSQKWTWTKISNGQTGRSEKVWCPHFALIYLFMLEIPVRKMQVVCLDSGEGDDLKWDNGWIKNDSENANYWSKNYGDSIGRGVIRGGAENGNKSISIYINTNKTQDIDKGFGASSGYTINWHNEAIINVVSKMRAWQEKYNPVSCPLAYRDVPSNIFADHPTEKMFNLIPDRFYLFRYPNNKNSYGKLSPPADHLLFKFWHLLMHQLESLLKEMGEDVRITQNWCGRVPNGSLFTPHSLRGSGLTALSEAGVPIEVLSKIIAGHSSILMTLYYVKYSNAYITSLLDEARLKVEKTEQENYAAYMKQATWDDACKYSIFNDKNFNESDWNSVLSYPLIENRQIGVCPNSGTRCGEGGECIRKNSKRDIHGPVPGGQGNCVRCRFFMTGLPFLIPLWLKVNKDLSDAQKISLEVDQLQKQLDESRSRRYGLVKSKGSSHIPASLQAEIQQIEAMVDSKSKKLNEVISNAHAGYNLVERLKGLSRENSSTLPALVDDDSSHDASQFTEVSLFKQRDFIVQASRLYPHVKDDLLERERNHFIDQIMFNLGLTPITLSSLTEQEKKSACDAASQFLNARLSDHELTMLENGSLKITDIGIAADKDTLISTIESKLNCIEVKEIL